MARVVWSVVARDDLKALVDYIKADSPGYARTFGWHIQQRVGQLQHFPESGRKVPEDASGTYRELIAGNYRVVYRVDNDKVTIVTLIHGARLLIL
ncbi:MAG: type II toxin-antitoxin system RelE/ParE family toxin [Nitrospirota bacterium]|nr:type II toxin-antitoxin system RelE/ParE family toxin [Nitrospirota bacterium]